MVSSEWNKLDMKKQESEDGNKNGMTPLLTEFKGPTPPIMNDRLKSFADQRMSQPTYTPNPPDNKHHMMDMRNSMH